MQAPEGNDSAWRPRRRQGLSARNLRETFEEVGICTWSLKPATRRVTVSESCRQVLGVPARLLSDLDAFQAIVHPEDRAARAAAIGGALERGGRYSIEHRARQTDREIRWLPAQGRAERSRGPSALRFRGIVSCNDAHRQAEARVQQIQADPSHVARLSAMGETASALAHELNQPLGAISIYAAACDSLLAEPGPIRVASARDALAAATGQAQLAGAIIRRLRECVTRGEADRRFESVADLLGEACNLALVGAREQGAQTLIDPGPLGIRVFVGRVQIQQVLVNLIRNAREAMRDSVRRDLAIVARVQDAGVVRIRVSDSGPGTPETIADTLLLPFVTTKSAGMEVGLSVSRSVVNAHGGRFWVNSTATGGATFHFTLPLAED